MNKYGFSGLLLLSLLASVAACASESDLGDHSAARCTADSIEGGYDYTETYEGECSAGSPPGGVFESSMSVTLDGDEAKITNGSDTLIHCTLSGCDCTTKSGDVFKWSADGFERIDKQADCTITTTGKKK